MIESLIFSFFFVELSSFNFMHLLKYLRLVSAFNGLVFP